MINTRAKIRTEGFTLAEMVVYIAIFGLVSVLIVNFVLTLSGTWGRGKEIRNAVNGGENIFDRLTQEVRLATGINNSQSTFGSHPGRLYLNTYTTATSTTADTLDIYTTGNELFLKRGSKASADSLSGPGLKVTNLIFNQIYAASTSEAVRIQLTVTSGSGVNLTTRQLQTAVVLKGK